MRQAPGGRGAAGRFVYGDAGGVRGDRQTSLRRCRSLFAGTEGCYARKIPECRTRNGYAKRAHSRYPPSHLGLPHAACERSNNGARVSNLRPFSANLRHRVFRKSRRMPFDSSTGGAARELGPRCTVASALISLQQTGKLGSVARAGTGSARRAPFACVPRVLAKSWTRAACWRAARLLIDRSCRGKRGRAGAIAIVLTAPRAPSPAQFVF